MKGKTVAILESRAREQMADLVRKYGGTPFPAPALAEVPDVDSQELARSIREFESQPPALYIFQTGVGTRALFAATDALGLTPSLMRLLAAACVTVRGPKPTAALRARGVRIDRAASDPFTTREVLAELEGLALEGKRVVVQRYGDANPDLDTGLRRRGAEVIEIATYRWDLPADLEPLRRLIAAVQRGGFGLAACTSAAQAANLFAVARKDGAETALRDGLNRARVASIGPVCSAMLKKLGVDVDIEASPPKLGPFIDAINRALAAGDGDRSSA
jgi:uroporphyrinogen-III synthase